MTSFLEFLQMQPCERIAHVQQHGLTKQERQELLKLNSVIASLLQQDAYKRGQREIARKNLYCLTITKRW
jgi:hypothetical protein